MEGQKDPFRYGKSDGLDPNSKWQRKIDNFIWPGDNKERFRLRSVIHFCWHCVSFLYAKVRCKTGVFDKKRIRHHFKIGFRC